MSNFYTDNAGVIVEVADRADGQVTFFPQGGGFNFRLPEAEFDKAFKPFEFGAFKRVMVTMDYLDVDGVAFPAWTNGQRWNGWAMPFFEFEVAAEMAARGDVGVYHDPNRFAFISPPINKGDESDVWERRFITVDGQQKVVYGIGAGYWCWWTKEVDQ